MAPPIKTLPDIPQYPDDMVGAGSYTSNQAVLAVVNDHNNWMQDPTTVHKTLIVDSSGNPWDLEENGGMPVNIQDQTTQPIDSLFVQTVSDFSLSADTLVSEAETLYYTFEATAGHGLTVGDEFIFIDTVSERNLFGVVTAVNTNTVTTDRPIDFIYPSATTLGRKVTTNMNVLGSLATPQLFTLRAGSTPTDIVRFIITILDDVEMDDAKFGGITALTNGLVLRIFNGFQKTIFNFKSNSDIKQFCYDVNYSDKAKQGTFGFGARITFGGQSKHGVVLRIGTDDVLQWVVQDDLTALQSLKIAGQGHLVGD